MGKARILTASAGSGKTYSLAYEYIYNTLRNQPEQKGGRFNPYAYRSILAVTFTNKATEEMKSRILSQIHKLATGQKCDYLQRLTEQTNLSTEELQRRAAIVRSAILHDYSRFSILTNDTFFQRIVRAFVKELGIEINYAIELDTAPVLQKSIEALIGEIGDNRDLRDWLTGFAEENIQTGKQWNIKQGIAKLEKELFKEDTREAIESIKDKQQFKERIFRYIALAEQQMESIKSAALEAVEIIYNSGYTHSDFLRSFTVFFEKIANFEPTMKSPAESVINHCYDDVQEWFKKTPKPSSELLSLAEALQPMLLDAVRGYDRLKYLDNSCTLLKKNYRSFALLGDLYKIAQQICRDENTMLLSQTKHTIASFVTEEDAPFIYEKVGNRFERFMIDEFQDTSLKEWQNFLPLLRNAISQSVDTSVLLVGDIKQSIYRWRGSDWNILGDIAPKNLSTNNTPIEHKNLDSNYRSLPEIVEFNNRTIASVVTSVNTHLNQMLEQALSEQKVSEECYRSLHNALKNAYNEEELYQKPKRESKNRGYIELNAHYTDHPDIVRCIEKLIYTVGYSPCDITILVRDRADAQKIAATLLEAGAKDKKMRFGIMTQEALKIGSSKSVEFIISAMRYAIDRTDTVSLGVYNRYGHNLDFMHSLTEEEIEFFDSLKSSSPEEAFELISIKFHNLLKDDAAYTHALHEQIIKFCASKVADLPLFLQWWEQNGSEKSVTIEKSRNAIEIMTIHKAKGLENKVVIIPYCTWRFTPVAIRPTTVWATPTAGCGLEINTPFPVQATSACKDSIFAEGYFKECVYSHIDAVNLLYVALTRAAEQLYIFLPIASKSDKEPSTVGELLCELSGISDKYHKVEEPMHEPPVVRSFGVCEMAAKKEEAQEHRIRLTHTPPSKVKLKLQLPTMRYFNPEQSAVVTPQQEGILLHKVMENAVTTEDISAAINSLVTDGILSTVEGKTLLNKITTMLSQSIAAKWFDGSYNIVRRESSIIAPGVGTKRPDRVMISGKSAVVVDYKFGERKNEYNRQIELYCQLLQQMGYSDIKGYIWYIREGKIDEIV